MQADRQKDQSVGLQDLQGQIQAFERWGGGFGGRPAANDAAGVATLGDPQMDQALPWGGLPRGSLHEVSGARDGAVTGFALALACRLLANRPDDHRIVWCQTAHEGRESGMLYGPALGAFGLDWRRLLMVHARRQIDLLWAMEEAVRCPGVGVVIGEVGAIDLRASRRLLLAAEMTGSTAIVMQMGAASPVPSAALTRWRVATQAAAEAVPVGIGNSRWTADLWRCRGGMPRCWTVEWNEQALCFDMAAAVADGPVEPALATVSA